MVVGVVDEVGAVVDVEPGAVVVGVEGTEDVGVVGVVGADDELADAPATVGLGAAVLRTETAAVAAGVLLSAMRAGLVAPASGG